MVFEEFKKLADKKKNVYDGDIRALINSELSGAEDALWSVVSFKIQTEKDQPPKARLTLRRGDQEFTEELQDGDGPIDAAFLVTEKITGVPLQIRDYTVQAATLGHDAQGEVRISVEHEGELVRGIGVSTDTVEATVMAMLDAVNRITSASGASETTE